MNRIANIISSIDDTTLTRDLSICCQAALLGGKTIYGAYALPRSLTYKSLKNLVTNTDLQAEVTMLSYLAQKTPEIPVMTEETESTHSLRFDTQCWVVDPLDGTTNFVHGFPYFATSIALIRNDQPIVGAIYAPMMDELFYAARGQGAWLNRHAITVSATDLPIAALVATGFPYDTERNLPLILTCLERILPKIRDLRRAGAAALDLAYLACGRVDGFYEMGLRPWDTAAGWLLAEEAGGTVTTLQGGSFSPLSSGIFASNTVLHQPLLSILNG